MSIIIKTEKVWKDNVQCRKIIDYKALEYDSTPDKYKTSGKVTCFTNPGNALVVWEELTTGEWYYLHKEDIIPEDEFQTILKLIRKAGDRLMKINKQLEQERQKQWSGKEKFVI